jgi:hypothetical protein
MKCCHVAASNERSGERCHGTYRTRFRCDSHSGNDNGTVLFGRYPDERRDGVAGQEEVVTLFAARQSILERWNSHKEAFKCLQHEDVPDRERMTMAEFESIPSRFRRKTGSAIALSSKD